MASLRRRLVIPTVLAVTLGGAAFVGCQSSGDDSGSGDDGPIGIATDGGVVTRDAHALDAQLPDAPPDARPDGPVG